MPSPAEAFTHENCRVIFREDDSTWSSAIVPEVSLLDALMQGRLPHCQRECPAEHKENGAPQVDGATCGCYTAQPCCGLAAHAEASREADHSSHGSGVGASRVECEASGKTAARPSRRAAATSGTGVVAFGERAVAAMGLKLHKLKMPTSHGTAGGTPTRMGWKGMRLDWLGLDGVGWEETVGCGDGGMWLVRWGGV